MQKHVIEIVTHLDDASGEVIGDACDTLLEEGAIDVWWQSIGMKKNRPGTSIHLLCSEDNKDAFAIRLLKLTGSIGCRFRTWERMTLTRTSTSIETRFGTIRIKQSWHGEKLVQQKPEWDDCVSCAATHQVAPRMVQLEALSHLK